MNKIKLLKILKFKETQIYRNNHKRKHNLNKYKIKKIIIVLNIFKNLRKALN